MPNGHDRDWIRFCAAIDGFRSRYHRWPTRVRITSGFREALTFLLGPDRVRLIEAKVLLVDDEDARIVAEDDAVGAYSYGIEGFSKKEPDIRAEDWLGVRAPPDETYEVMFLPSAPAARRWLGVDFSGNASQWRAGTRKSNVWIAEVQAHGAGFRLADLRRVQDLSGEEAPFDRLAALLRGNFAAAAIDAPFSLPVPFVRDHQSLLRLAGQMNHRDRPFASGSELVIAVAGQPPPLSPKKPLRATELYWQGKGVNVRSTLWAGPRGGAPMTAACLTLLDLAGGPVWPFTPSGPSLLVEGFPAAQLAAWKLPHQRYGHAVDGRGVRDIILKGIEPRVELGSFRPQLEQSADALDAVLCAFGAIALTEGCLLEEPGPTAPTEGWIAVHR